MHTSTANHSPMPRHKRSQQKAASRQRILVAASRLFKLRGYDGVGIDEIMACANMTAGGFYAHFPSKQALFAEIAKQLPSRDQLREAATTMPADRALRQVIELYLSREHRDAVSEGCPVPSLAASISRSDNEVKRAFTGAFDSLIREVEAVTGMGPDDSLPLIALLLGGLTLSRTVGTQETSDRILAACRSLAMTLAPLKEPVAASAAKQTIARRR